VIIFTAGTAFVMWIGESITAKGVGNGVSLIIMVNILSRVPSMIRSLANYENKWALIILLVVFILVVAFVVLLSLGERRIPIQYAKRMQGRKQYGGQSTHIPVRVNLVGVIPIIFAISLLSFPQIITGFFNSNPTGTWGTILNWLSTSHWFGACLYIVLIILFTYFYASITFNPMDIADNLKKNGGFIPGFRAGKPTSEFISRVLNRITLFGSIYLGVVAALPIAFSRITKAAGISLGGTSIIIVVGVSIEIVQTLENQMLMRHYKGFLE
jgi:preprotein translocase subunit SecY